MSTDLITTNSRPGTAMTDVLSSRHAQEIQAAMVIAKKCPRDEVASIERIRRACERHKLAEQAVYQYPRGGTKVEGPSIRLAEAMAQNWGNLDFGMVEIEQRDGESDVMAYCWDLETNTRQTKVFTVRHERHKKGGMVDRLTDPRDVYEMVANQGARRLRACILGVIPGDVQDVALEQCRKTLLGNSEKPMSDRIQGMVAAFAEFQVTPAMLENYLGYKLSACDIHGLTRLRGVWQSLHDGMSKREDWFDTAPSHVEQADAARKAREASGSNGEPAESEYPGEQPAADANEETPQTPNDDAQTGLLADYSDELGEAGSKHAVTRLRNRAVQDKRLTDQSREAIVEACDAKYKGL